MQKQWTANRYHALGDDLTQPVDLEAAMTFNRMARELAVAVANAAERIESSFFRRLAGHAGQGRCAAYLRSSAKEFSGFQSFLTPVRFSAIL